jgi:hypothetical protein
MHNSGSVIVLSTGSYLFPWTVVITGNRTMIKKLMITALATACLFLAGCVDGTSEPGRLEGNVTIGPIMPVERPGQTYEIPCEVYKARKVMVYDRSHDKLIKQVDIDCSGHYSVELKPGQYVVDINRIGIDHSSEVPATVEIASGETVTLNIDIDTGIR